MKINQHGNSSEAKEKKKIKKTKGISIHKTFRWRAGARLRLRT
jgi:hypothetical protein